MPGAPLTAAHYCRGFNYSDYRGRLRGVLQSNPQPAVEYKFAPRS